MKKLFDFLGIIVFINEIIIAGLMLFFVSLRPDINEDYEKPAVITFILVLLFCCIEFIIIFVSIILNIFQ